MRWLFMSLAVLVLASTTLRSQAADPNTDLDKQIVKVLKDVHNRAAGLYDVGDAAGCYRMLEGSLATVRGLLGHHPEEQKFIEDSLAAAEKLPDFPKRAYHLHQTIDKLRTRIRVDEGVKTENTPEGPLPEKRDKMPSGKPAPKPEEKSKTSNDKGTSAELLTHLPREAKSSADSGPGELRAPKKGLAGLVAWKGQPVADVRVTFVSKNREMAEIYNAQTDAWGRYVLSEIAAGKYTVLLQTGKKGKIHLPERYQSTVDSPLIVDLQPGDTLPILLQ